MVHDTRAQVPYGVALAAGWAGRFLLIFAAGYVIARILALLIVIVLPLIVAVLLTALLVPAVTHMVRLHVPRGIASLVVLLSTFAAVASLLVLAGQQIGRSSRELSQQVVRGLDEIRDWLMTGPLHASESQINTHIASAQRAVASSNAQVVDGLTSVTETVSHVLAGIFIVLFATYFFLADGNRIWSWLVGLFPRAARQLADSSGHVAWTSLTAFVRGTIAVAFIDAIGVVVVAGILRVPFLFAIAVLVFIGAFIPIIGALFSGLVAVMVALVDQGPVVALIMLGGVVAVQQLEAHVLQPFLLGRLVSLHPLGIILAIAAGVLIAGTAGALVAVPLLAVVNAVTLHLARQAQPQAPGEVPARVADGP